MPERRKNIRKPIDYTLEVVDTVDNSVLGTVVDISISGILIQSSHQFKVNEYYNLLIKFPKNKKFPKKDIEVFVEPKWIKETKKQQYHIGCQIIKIKTDDRKNIEDFINKEPE